MEKERIYNEPEFKVLKYNTSDVITTSGEGAGVVDPPWGGEIVSPIGL